MRFPRLRLRVRDVHLTDRGRALVAGGLTLTVAGILLGFVDLARIGLLLVVLPACAVLMSLWGRPALRVSRVATPSPVPSGESTEVVATVTHTGRHRSGTCLVEDTVRAAGDDGFEAEKYQRFQLPSLSRGGAARLRYHLAPVRRGRHELGPLRIRMSDPFGLTHYSADVAGTSEFIALTRLTPLPGRVTAPEGEESTDLANLVVAGPGEPSPTVREYRHGDDTRRIHWSASARRGELLVRVEEQASARRAVIVLDQRFPALSGYASEALDWSVEALASAAMALGASGHVLHLVCDERLDDVRLLDPVDADEIVRVLSCAVPLRARDEDAGRTRRLRESAVELASEGGLLITAVPDVPSIATPSFTGRPPRATGLAFVVRTDVGGDAEQLASSASTGGWHAVAVDPDTDAVDEAWGRLAASVAQGGLLTGGGR
ncbi:MAG: DUF58 domain-containing protein [Dermatophilus congolensis]|nr:DUF58 domain-containing protein [Dermatophilus congolensis]